MIKEWLNKLINLKNKFRIVKELRRLLKVNRLFQVNRLYNNDNIFETGRLMYNLG
jgi:hypothetical protein